MNAESYSLGDVRGKSISAAVSTPVSVSENKASSWYLPVKCLMDFVFAAVLLVMAAPIIIVAAIFVKLTSQGPIFYTQRRVGRNGRVFKMIKLRTMKHNCESLSGPMWSTQGDARITPMGRILRRTHVDELPQLWNVIRGDMSLVGPRPERPELTPELEESIPNYADRLQVRPGIAGLAQIHLPADVNLESVRCKLVYDLYYIRRMNFWLDLRILFPTCLRLLGIPFSLTRSLFRVPGRSAIEEASDNSAGDSSEMPKVQLRPKGPSRNGVQRKTP